MQSKEQQDAESQGVHSTADLQPPLSTRAGQPVVTNWSPSARREEQPTTSKAEESVASSVPGTEYWLP